MVKKLSLRAVYREKKLIVFDLDGTLTKSKAPMDSVMAHLIHDLLLARSVAVIGGGRYEQFRNQFIKRLRLSSALSKKLFLFPTTSTAFYRYSRGWKKVYSKDFQANEKKKIIKAFHATFKKFSYHNPSRLYGEVIEDRGTQITFSAVGQRAPISKKEKWNKENDALRARMVEHMHRLLLGFEVRSGGLTSIDVMRKGIDKAYGIRQIEKYIGVADRDMLFVGDRIFPGGNDYEVIKTRVAYIQVTGPEDTKKVIRFLIQS